MKREKEAFNTATLRKKRQNNHIEITVKSS